MQQSRRALPGETNRWPISHATPQADAEITLVDSMRALWRRKWIVGGMMLAGALIGAATASVQPRVYRGVASVEFEDADDVQTEVKVLQQEALVEQAVKKLNLDQRSDYAVDSGWTDHLRALLALPPMRPAALTSAIRKAKRNLRITPARQERAIEIVYDSTDPRLAADFPNTLAHVFRDPGPDGLNPQLLDLRGQLDRDQAVLQSFTQSATGQRARKLDRYNMLKRRLDETKQLYDSMLEKVSEARVTSINGPAITRLVPAEKPASPYRPNLPADVGMGLFAGTIFGIGAAMLLKEPRTAITGRTFSLINDSGG